MKLLFRETWEMTSCVYSAFREFCTDKVLGRHDSSTGWSAERGTSGSDRQSEWTSARMVLKANFQVEEKKKKAEAEVV
jgi:hypothetical protein